jgi:hypothetical protein
LAGERNEPQQESERTMYENTILASMSPATLASFIADIDLLNKGAETLQLRCRKLAYKSLVSNVGETEAERFIDDAYGAAERHLQIADLLN